MRGLDLDLLLFVTSAGLLAANNTGWGKVKGPSKQASLVQAPDIFVLPELLSEGRGQPTHIDLAKGGQGGCSHFLLPHFPASSFFSRLRGECLASAVCATAVFVIIPALHCNRSPPAALCLL